MRRMMEKQWTLGLGECLRMECTACSEHKRAAALVRRLVVMEKLPDFCLDELPRIRRAWAALALLVPAVLELMRLSFR